MSKFTTLLGLAALGGGVYYLASTRKKYPVNGECPAGYHLMPDGTCMSDDDPAMKTAPGGYTPGPGGYSPPGWDALQGTYQSVLYGHGSLADCQRLLGYFDSLEPETQAEANWIQERQSEVNTFCAHQYSAAPTLPSVVSQWQDELNRCWTSQCSQTEVNMVIRALDSAATFYQGMIPGDQIQTIRYASSELNNIQNMFATQGVPHVGNCGCAQCQIQDDRMAQMIGQDEEPCCAACAAKGTGACSCTERNPFEEPSPCGPTATAGT